ncbi:MAG: hypothetical protein IPP43_10685 [Chitinophagaceae bacterium]|nr:hypothetical protein [Chitinophagaceae bacterium]
MASRWGFNEGTGAVGANSIGGGPVANLIASPIWRNGFNLADRPSLDFNGTSDYVTFGAAPSLNTSTFTLEAWIKIEGTGVATATSGVGLDGSEGATSGIPIIATKGTGDADNP